MPGYNPAAGAVSTTNSTLTVTTNSGAGGNTALTMASGSTFEVNLNSAMAVTLNGANAPTGGFAYLNADGSIVNLNGGSAGAGATLTVLADGTIHAGQSYLLIDPSQLTGAFTSSGITTGAESLPYTLTYLGPAGNNDVVLTVVPEPSTALLGSLAGAAAAFCLARRRRAAARCSDRRRSAAARAA